jgi:hypothetical protein
MEYYGKSKFQNSNSYVKDEVETCMDEFFQTADKEIPNKGKSLVLTHPCLLGKKIFIKANHAVEYFEYDEEDFD